MKKLWAVIPLLLLTSFAYAADLSTKAPVYAPITPAPAMTWTGFYVGVDVGYGWANVNNDAVLDPTNSVTIATKENGIIGGAYGGFNYQFGSWMVVGLETDLSYADIKGTGTVDGKIDVVPFAAQSEDRLRWLGTTRARVGFLPWQSLLIYGTGGVAYGGVENNTIVAFGASSINSDLAVSATTNETKFGWAAGAGAEYMITPSLLARAEWLHYDLGSTINFVDQTNRHKGDVVRAGVAWKF